MPEPLGSAAVRGAALVSAAALLSTWAGACAPPLVLGPPPTSTTLQATTAAEQDPEVKKALAELTPAQRDLAMRVLTRLAVKKAPFIAKAVQQGNGEAEILSKLLPDEEDEKGNTEAAADAEPDAEAGRAGDSGPPAPPPLPPLAYRKVDVAPWSPILGPREAKVTLVLFSDFQCPYCGRIEQTLARLRDKYGDTLRIVWRNQPLSFHNRAMPSATAAMAAARQGKFWPYHDKLFAAQRQLEDEDLSRYAAELGLDMQKFAADSESAEVPRQIAADVQAAALHGADGTPTSFVNGRKVSGAHPYETFTRIIDEELVRADAVLARGVALRDLYPTLLKELAETPVARRGGGDDGEEPERAEVKIPADAPSRGARNAPVTLVEFSDFQCPFCGRAAGTVSALEKKYGSRLRVVYMHQPLPFHQYAQIAAEASMAAHAQGRFWPFHDKLFDNQRSLTREDLERYAGEVGLDLLRFKRDLDDHRFGDRVRADSAEGDRVGARGTPTFFVNGAKLPGAQSQERFEALIDKALAGNAGAGKAGGPRARAGKGAKAAAVKKGGKAGRR